MTVGRPPKPVMERLMALVTKAENGCWEYAKGRAGDSYRQIGLHRAAGRSVAGFAHRVSYEHFVGPIAEGMQIDHLCRNRMCVNPDHLEPVTPQENVRRAKALITQCPQGHDYDAENTAYSRSGQRYCRECKRIKALARYYANKEQIA